MCASNWARPRTSAQPGRKLEIGGIAIYEGARPVALINGEAVSEGEVLSEDLYVRSIRKDLIEELALISDGYAIETEMLLKACYRGARIGHAKIRTIYDDETSYFRPVRDTTRIALAAIYFKVFHED